MENNNFYLWCYYLFTATLGIISIYLSICLNKRREGLIDDMKKAIFNKEIDYFEIPEKDIWKQDMFFYKLPLNLTPILNQSVSKHKKMFFYRNMFLLIIVIIWLLTEISVI